MQNAYIDLLVFFIGASLLLYIILGGADYGAGILGLFPLGSFRKSQRELITKAIGPVWEANHMWLILIVVILFMGFPGAFIPVMVSLHLPFVALLVGVVTRGSAFAFRSYDPNPTPRSIAVESILFSGSSLWSSFWLGVIGASLYRGRIDSGASDFHSAYIAPWFGLFPACMGIFVIFNFAYLASAFLIGETEDKSVRRFYSRRAFAFNILVILSGAIVFMAAEHEGLPLLSQFVHNEITLACMALATLLFLALWFSRGRENIWMTRLLALGQTALILLGWLTTQAPNIIVTSKGPISFYEAAAPEATLKQLSLALVVGSVFIFPSLYFLLRVLKRKNHGRMV